VIGTQVESLSTACWTLRRFEECYPLKRTFLLSILAVIPAVALSVPASAQVEPAHKKAADDSADVNYKWEAYGGFAYTSLDQVNESRSGLMGVKAGATRDFGKWFGLTAEGSWYKYPYTSGNPGTPVVLSGLPCSPRRHHRQVQRLSPRPHRRRALRRRKSNPQHLLRWRRRRRRGVQTHPASLPAR
jgi:hypothetical protein